MSIGSSFELIHTYNAGAIKYTESQVSFSIKCGGAWYFISSDTVWFTMLIALLFSFEQLRQFDSLVLHIRVPLSFLSSQTSISGDQ